MPASPCSSMDPLKQCVAGQPMPTSRGRVEGPAAVVNAKCGKIGIFCGFSRAEACAAWEKPLRHAIVRAAHATRPYKTRGVSCTPSSKTLPMKAVVFDKFGEPRDVLHLRDMPVPEPGPGQVRVRMHLVPINPSDLLVVRGQYGRLPALPATPGFEGVGVIEATGSGFLRILRGLRPGRRVAVLNRQGGNWQEQVVVPARQLVPVPADIPDEQVASFFVNPATALVMTRWVLRLPRGAWLLQTAAGSALGRML